MPTIAGVNLEIAKLYLTDALSKIVPGATSLALRNSADSADNLLITDAGAATFRSNVKAIKTASPTSSDGTVILDESAADTGASLAMLRRSDSSVRNLIGGENIGAAQFDIVVGQDTGMWRKLIIRVNALPKLATFDNTGRLILDQEAQDGEIFALRSSDVAHGITAQTTTDTFGVASKQDSGGGGLNLSGYSELTAALALCGYGTNDNTTKSTAARGYVHLQAAKKSGASIGDAGADANLVCIINGGTGNTTHIFDKEGDSHQDVGTAWTNFDDHEDVALLNLLSAHVTRPDDPLRDSFRTWLECDREVLQRHRLVSFNEDGHHFVNLSRLQMLTVGAVRQLAARLELVERQLLEAA